MNGNESDAIWGKAQLADFLGISPRTFDQWRYRGTGPRGFRVGRYVKWRKSEVLRWVTEQESQTGRPPA